MLYGFLFGTLFPILAIFILLNISGQWSFHHLMIIHKESHLLWIIDTAPIFLGIFSSFSGYQLDKLNNKYQENIKLKKIAEEATESKSIFFASMSHELRTPLTSIIGYNNILGETALNEEQKEYHQIINDVSVSMLQIVNNILDTSKLEKTKTLLAKENIDLNKLFIKSCKSLESIVNKDVDFTFESNFKFSYVIGDSGRLNQIFTNLIGNAIKFTSKGSIHAKMNIKELEADKLKINFEVLDTGIGIKEEMIPDVFQPYSQINDKIKSGILSTGLGLSITNQLVELMNGKISVSSNYGYGSIFSFIIKLDKGIKTNEKEERHLKLKNLTGKGNVLLAEDNLLNQMLIKKILTEWNLQVSIANNGNEALKLLEKNKFDLILMDAEMPEMDGMEATNNIRNSKKKFADTPIIFLSANKFKNENEMRDKYGINNFITKPYDLADLSKAINSYIVLNNPTDEL